MILSYNVLLFPIQLILIISRVKINNWQQFGFEKMRQNNNQQQISDEPDALKLREIKQSSMSQKVLELQVQLHNSEKYYQYVRKPIKCFSKFKSSLQGTKSSQKSSEFGILSQKIISPNPDDDHLKNENPIKFQKSRLKNVYQAYKQALEQKYKNRMRSFERQILKINNTKIQKSPQQVGHQLIYKHQEDQKKRLSNKKIDQSIISNLQTLSTQTKQPSIIRTLNHKKKTSFLLESMQEPNKSFLNQLQRKPKEKKFPAQYYDYLLSPKNQAEICQIKKRCYTELREFENQESKYLTFNKTRNVSFKLPTENVKTKKSLIEKLGGITYNLPKVNDKMNEHDSNKTISYLVKSLKRPSKSLNSKCVRQFVSPLQDLRKASESLPKQRKKTLNIKNHTQTIERTQQIPMQETLQEGFHLSNYFISSQRNKPHKYPQKSTYNKSEIKKSKCKLNATNDIEGWNIDSEVYQVENNDFGADHIE